MAIISILLPLWLIPSTTIASFINHGVRDNTCWDNAENHLICQKQQHEQQQKEQPKQTKQTHDQNHEKNHNNTIISNQPTTWNGYAIPSNFSCSFGEYPNPWNITDHDRTLFYPVIKFPKLWHSINVPLDGNDDGSNSHNKRSKMKNFNENKDDKGDSQPNMSYDRIQSAPKWKLFLPRRHRYRRRRIQVWNVSVYDGTQSSSATLLATEEQRHERRLQKQNKTFFWFGFGGINNLFAQSQSTIPNKLYQPPSDMYGIGKYDENRVSLYTSPLFEIASGATRTTTTNAANTRTLHVGIDLGGPVGTKVHAFTNGIIHSVGYNPDLGDYGNVIVIEHDLNSTQKCPHDPTKKARSTSSSSSSSFQQHQKRRVWALYGHLDDPSIVGKKVGQCIRKGQVIGRIGDYHENGGWYVCQWVVCMCTYVPII